MDWAFGRTASTLCVALAAKGPKSRIAALPDSSTMVPERAVFSGPMLTPSPATSPACTR